MASIDLGDVQGNILRAYAMPVARYWLMRVADPEAARRTLLELSGDITSALPWPRDPETGETVKPDSTFNVAFTWKGLYELGVPMATLSGFSTAFQEGMLRRTAAIGDDDESAPDHWDEEWTDGRVHVWASINAVGAEELEAACGRLRDRLAEAHGLEVVATQSAAALGGTTKEHFGYTDGLGNPWVDGSRQERETRTGRLTDDGAWVPLATGEFLLGYPGEGREVAPMPLPPEFSRNGTFMAYRKLQQHVGRFRRFLEREGARYPGGEDLLAAKLVGRWRDGTPLALSPYHPDESKISDNTFTYADDPEGKRCPLGAHIRRANPRAAPGFNGKLVNRHRILRRGLPYGPPLPDDAEEDGQERGIVFLALNADLEKQFEFVLRQWMNYGNEFSRGNERDPIIGNADIAADGSGDGTFLIQGDARDPAGHPPWLCTRLQRFVTTRGGDYFFIPSLSGVRMIATGQVDAR